MILIPFIFLFGVPFYNVVNPEWGGVPFFWWYQMVWLVICGVLFFVAANLLGRKSWHASHRRNGHLPGALRGLRVPWSLGRQMEERGHEQPGRVGLGWEAAGDRPGLIPGGCRPVHRVHIHLRAFRSLRWHIRRSRNGGVLLLRCTLRRSNVRHCHRGYAEATEGRTREGLRNGR